MTEADDAAVAAKRNRWGSLELQCNIAINETAAVSTLVSATEDETRSKRPRHNNTTPPQQQVQNQKLSQPSNNIQTESTTTSTISLKDWIKKSDVDNRIDQCVKIAYMLVGKLSTDFKEVNNKDSSSVEVEDEHLSGQIVPKPKDICVECITITMDTSGNANDVGFVSIYQNFDWGDDTIGNEDVISNNNNKRQELGLMFEALGKLFYKLFMNGEEPPQFSPNLNNAESKSLSRSDSSGSIVPTEDDVIKMLSQQPKQKCANTRILSTMRNKGLPSSVCQFITDLFDSSRIDGEEEDGIQSKTSDSFFTSLMDVQLELKQMIDCPEAYLYGTITSRWDIVFGNNHMFGREAELKQLKDVIDNTEKKKELVLISGRAGTGKTRLVNEIRKSLLSKGWIFLRCKFGKTVHSRSLSIIALGIDLFFSSEMCGATVVEKVYDRLVHLIGVDGIKYLCQHMPGLRRLVDRQKNKENSLNDGTTSMPAEYSDLYLFSSLLDTISSISRVLFFVDDLQWASEESLKLLSSLVSHKTTSCNQSNKTIFVCAYRDNEINKDFFHMNDTSENINTTQISLCGFNREILNEMISDSLCLPRRKTRSLAESILSKTKGIPLYVVEFLDALWTEKLLVQSEGQWEWDCDVIDLKAINRGVAVLLADQLKDLQADLQHGLQILACFGFCHVDTDVLEAVNAMSALQFAKKEGFVDSAGSEYTFAHSIIQQAAYDMISCPDRNELLERLVACLVPLCMHKGSSDHVLFVTIGLINKIGSDFPPPQSKLYAKLNLRAGETSMNNSDFEAAIKYFTSGISLLGPNRWKDEYELSLSLFEQTASAYYSQGNHEQQVVEYSNQVLKNAKSFEDKFISHQLSQHLGCKQESKRDH